MTGAVSQRTIVLAACAVFALCALVPSAELFSGSHTSDVALYQVYGEQIVHGKIPYHDFFMEYPPGAIPVFAAPTVDGSNYVQLWKFLMLGCGLGCLLLMAAVLRRVGADTRRTAFALGVVALSPLLLGPAFHGHYDPWPALLTALSLVLLLSGRGKTALFVLGIAVAAKVYPIVLVPLAVVYVLRHDGAPAARRSALACAGALLLAMAPFAVVGAGGLRFSLEFQTRRPLQIESLGSSLLLTAHHLSLYRVHEISSYNSANLGGRLPAALGAVSVVATLVAVIGIWILFERGRADDESLLTASAAALVAYVALGKVLSPQYMVWLLPFVPLVAGSAGVVSSILLMAALVLTQLLVRWGIGLGGADWVLLTRNLLLLTMLMLLVVPLVQALRRRPSAVPGASART